MVLDEVSQRRRSKGQRMIKELSHHLVLSSPALQWNIFQIIFGSIEFLPLLQCLHYALNSILWTFALHSSIQFGLDNKCQTNGRLICDLSKSVLTFWLYSLLKEQWVTGLFWPLFIYQNPLNKYVSNKNTNSVKLMMSFVMLKMGKSYNSNRYNGKGTVEKDLCWSWHFTVKSLYPL